MKIGFGLRTIALAVSVGLVAPLASAETLADAMVSAYRHSGLLDKNRALLRAADEDVAVAMSALKPIVNWSADLTYNNRLTVAGVRARTENITATAGLAGELLLYDFGASQLRIDVAKETVLATRQALVSAEQRVLLNAMSAYIGVKQASETVRLRQNNMRLLRQELQAAKDRFEVGEVTRTDVSLTEARLAATRAQLAGAQGDLARAVEAFRAAVGRKPGKLVRPKPIGRPAKSLAAAKNLALRTHPDMKAVQHQVTASELGIALAESGKKPTVKLRGTAGLSEQLNSGATITSGSLGVEVAGPIYQGGRLSALERKARAQRDAARGDLHIARHTLAEQVGNAWAQLEVARATAAASARQVRAADLAFRGVREEASLGARTTLDVLNAEQSLLDARTSLLNAQYSEVSAGYVLLATMGLLTAERLKLNVPRYDPAAYYNLVKTAPTNRSKQGQQLDRVLKKLGKN